MGALALTLALAACGGESEDEREYTLIPAFRESSASLELPALVEAPGQPVILRDTGFDSNEPVFISGAAVPMTDSGFLGFSMGLGASTDSTGDFEFEINFGGMLGEGSFMILTETRGGTRGIAEAALVIEPDAGCPPIGVQAD